VVTTEDLTELVAGLELVDHHCHSVVAHDLDPAPFDLLLGESGRPTPAGCSPFDTSLGLAVRAWCAPRLDLVAGADGPSYLARRLELGAVEVNARMLAGGARQLLVDTGYRPDELAQPAQLARWAAGSVYPIARLETLAEVVADSLGKGAGAADRYADRLALVVAEQGTAVGWKSIAAYRGGLGLDWRRPTPDEVRAAAAEWLSQGPPWRLTHPVLIRHGVWTAIDTGRPVQFHTGFGDTDAPLHGSHPALLSDLIAASADIGTPLMLLHCWPRHREAGYLAQMWPHVYLDVGEALPHVGHRGGAVLAETLELAPWHKVLYASDAFGLAELYHLGVVTHRRALVEALRPLADLDFDRAELSRLGSLVAHGNARRVYPGVTPPG